jgi:hypothetical protein
MQRFAILFHDWPEPHFDFLVEDGDSCLTWRIKELPISGKRIPAEPLPNHRLIYLDYEGVVSNNRGSVKRVESGEIDQLEKTEHSVSVKLKSRTLNGTAYFESNCNPAILLFTRCG